MQSRMDKYKSSEKKLERTKKNTQLYEDVYDDIYRDTTYKNMQVLDSAKEINLNKLKDILDDKYDTRQYRTFKNYDLDNSDFDEKIDYIDQRHKSYDINEIINDAKNKRAFIEEAKEKQKYIEFTERSRKYEENVEQLEKEEKELEDLINTMTIPKTDETNDALDLLSDLKGNENTVVTKPITTSDNLEETTRNLEKTLVKADKTFYTDSNMFTKNDFEDFNTLTKKLNRKTSKLKVFIRILLLIRLGVCAYFAIMHFGIKK